MGFDMEQTYVIFTQRAFNAIVTETIDKHPIETGGIFIGYVLDNGAWIVVETIPPGYKTIHQRAYFEYDAEFVNYLSNVIGLQYKGYIQVLGLWHRHPGSMDVFSTTDDETNRTFAAGKQYGSISALVNCDPTMRLTMYHVDKNGHYKQIEWCVDDGETIPEDFLALHYPNSDNLPTFDINGVVSQDNNRTTDSEEDENFMQEVEQKHVESKEIYSASEAMKDICSIIRKYFNQ